jgi:hypothetical protein
VPLEVKAGGTTRPSVEIEARPKGVGGRERLARGRFDEAAVDPYAMRAGDEALRRVAA